MPYIGNTLVTTVRDEAVTFAKIQDVAANSILGRNANSSGDLSEIALATTQILIGDGTGFTAAALSGDATMTNAGVVSLAAAQTNVSSILATDVKIGEDDQTKIDFETADEIHFYAANVEQVYVADNIFGPQSDSDVDLGTTSVRWKDAFVDSITVTGAIASGAITSTGIVTGTGFTAGNAVLAEAELELLDGLTAGTAIASKVVTTDANIDTSGQRNLTITGELDAASLDISGNADIDGTTNLDAVDIDGAVQIDNTVTVGVDDTGYDVKFFGATSGAYLLWDESADKLLTAGGAVVDIVKDKLLIGGTAVTTTAAELNVLDAVTAGTATASKAIVLDSNKDIGTIRNLTIDGVFTDGNYTFDTSGNVSGLGTVASGAITSSGIVTGTGFTAGSAVLTEAELELLDGLTAGTAIASKVVTTDANVASGAITSSGIIKTDSTTAATTTTDGSLQTDGGLSVVLDAVFGNDVKLLSDSAVLVFGAGSDITLTHTNDVGLTLNGTSKLMFNDASQFIQGASATVLDIAATDEIELTATLIDVVGNFANSGTIASTGVITANAGVVVDNITIDGTEIDLSSGDLTIDVAGDVEVNADGGQIIFKDGSAAIAELSNESGNGELRIYEGANYLGFKTPALSANQVWVLPDDDGSANQYMKTDGSGNLSWVSASSGVGIGLVLALG